MSSNINNTNSGNIGRVLSNNCVGLKRTKAGFENGSTNNRGLSVENANSFANVTKRGRAPLAPLDKVPVLRQPLNSQRNVPLINKNGAIRTSAKPAPVNSFKIYRDEENDENVAANEVPDEPGFKDTKSSDVTAPARQPLATLSLNPEPRDASMFVETQLESETNDDSELSENVKKQLSEELIVGEYAKDIYEYLRELEIRSCPRPNYMAKQPDITYGMRSILIDWLVEVTEEYRLQTETLYLAISYIDRFLSCMSVLRSKLQLVGTASMLIASKYEEIYPPEVEEFVFITDDTYSQAQVLRMEQVILKVLKFDLAIPTIFCFLQRFSHLHEVDEQCYHLAMYLCELTLLEADPYLQFLPSVIAGSALCLACHTFDKEPWSPQMTEFTGYTLGDFRLCISAVLKTYVNAANYPQQAIREKYRSEKFSSVANLSPPLTVPL